MPKIRCAIYTRKSSEEGLEQEFNSLHAQREACAAYVASQKAEGWVLMPTEYDDGGISGGTLERPALQRLLGDIDAGLVDQIVVYKIDRLTRSLADFAKIVDRLDAAGASFVSVTQSFNTATSMGRLTLNMLLSFAQFEREVTASLQDQSLYSSASSWHLHHRFGTSLWSHLFQILWPHTISLDLKALPRKQSYPVFLQEILCESSPSSYHHRLICTVHYSILQN